MGQPRFNGSTVSRWWIKFDQKSWLLRFARFEDSPLFHFQTRNATASSLLFKKDNNRKHDTTASTLSTHVASTTKYLAMSGPAVQFVRVCLGDSYRVVTFYEDQPVHELKTLLGALFPGTTAANGQAPVAIERLMDGVVVPLSSATKCPQVMSEGSWELLVSRPNNLTTEKLILQGFLHDLFAHGIVTSGTRQNGAWQRGKRSARNPRTSPLQGN